MVEWRHSCEVRGGFHGEIVLSGRPRHDSTSLCFDWWPITVSQWGCQRGVVAKKAKSAVIHCFHLFTKLGFIVLINDIETMYCQLLISNFKQLNVSNSWRFYACARPVLVLRASAGLEDSLSLGTDWLIRLIMLFLGFKVQNLFQFVNVLSCLFKGPRKKVFVLMSWCQWLCVHSLTFLCNALIEWESLVEILCDLPQLTPGHLHSFKSFSFSQALSCGAINWLLMSVVATVACFESFAE